MTLRLQNFAQSREDIKKSGGPQCIFINSFGIRIFLDFSRMFDICSYFTL